MNTKYFKYNGNDSRARAMAPDTANALISFCKQEKEFEQAVNQSGKTFDQCMDAVALGVKNSISDLEAFRRAVKFYFPTADIEFRMVLKTSEYDSESEPVKEKAKHFSLSDLF